MQSEYAQEFAVFKPDKKLKWLHHLGTVQLEIELEDRKLDPLEAAFIELFSQKRNFLFTLFLFLDVLDITDWPIFLSYLGSRRPHGGCWACRSKCDSQGVVDMGRSL